MAIWWSETDRDANNWDLHAVVRGCSFYTSPTTTTSAAATIDPFSSSRKEEEGVDIGESDELEAAAASTTKNAIHELEELCKPFFPKPNIQQLPRESIGSSSSTAPFPKPNIQQVPRESIGTTAPSSKRRKKQQTKKVVCQVPAGRMSSDSDMWAWRKYGQKPIKGSPYPRGYYKCSSSKGCMARKQVECSRTDPSMLVITYSAEHDHPPPTRRNSLAGSTRNKLPPSSVSDGGSQ